MSELLGGEGSTIRLLCGLIFSILVGGSSIVFVETVVNGRFSRPISLKDGASNVVMSILMILAIYNGAALIGLMGASNALFSGHNAPLELGLIGLLFAAIIRILCVVNLAGTSGSLILWVTVALTLISFFNIYKPSSFSKTGELAQEGVGMNDGVLLVLLSVVVFVASEITVALITPKLRRE
jgi:hypothetical protein